MRKALILTVIALFSSEALAQKSFRHAPTVALDDIQDNQMVMMKFERPAGSPPPFNPSSRFDDFEDDMLLDQYEVFMLLGNGRFSNDGIGDGRFLNDGGPRPHDSFASQNPSFLGSGQSGVFVQGGSAPQGGVFSSGAGQMTGPIGSTGANWIAGASAGYSPGAPISITPHVGISIPFK